MNTSIIEELFLRSWWVILILLLCLAFYEHEQKKRNAISSMLEAKVNELQNEKTIALEKKKRYMMDINSQNDPSWIEFILIEKLGLTPEGQTKVFFTESKN